MRDSIGCFYVTKPDDGVSNMFLARFKCYDVELEVYTLTFLRHCVECEIKVLNLVVFMYGSYCMIDI